MPKTKQISKRGVTSADKALGEKIRAFRNAIQMSQDDLGKKLGVSFQQIQKYEKGVNRVSVARLAQIARALNVPQSSFYDTDKVGEDKTTAELIGFFGDPFLLRAARSLSKLPLETKHSFVKLIEKVEQNIGEHDIAA